MARPTRGRRYKKDIETGEIIHYLDVVTAFDIETSKIQFSADSEDWHGWMYIWQWQIGEIVTVIGRTWEEWLSFVSRINAVLEARNCRMMSYTHNLSFEFTYLSGICPFTEKDVFATDAREVLYCNVGRIEMRCSQRLSGYSLAKWCNVLEVDHRKLLGNLDYSVVRYPWTDLTAEELAYCVNDVVGLVECVIATLKFWGDTLYSIPYTQTGYIRRRVKQAMKCWSFTAIRGMQNPLSVYTRLREAYRGGDAHANKLHVGDVLGDIYSYDRSSSYPDVMVHCKFPMTKFREEAPTLESLDRCLKSGRAVLFKISFWGLRLKNRRTGNPYVPYAKCCMRGYEKPRGVMEDNGRILECEYCEIALTDIDYDIISHQYTWEQNAVHWVMTSRYGYLPQPLIDVILELYKQKTELKGVPGAEQEYQHTKQLINSVFGMCSQQPISQRYLYRNERWERDDEMDYLSEYEKAIDRAFLNYAWAVWITAWARFRLYEGIRIATRDDLDDFVYADTDSVKCRMPADFESYNKKRIRDALRSGAHATDPQGVEHYMGVYEYEGKYNIFKTLGTKRYATVDDDGTLTITVAGVPKRNGSTVLKASGGILAFNFNYTFKNTGKTGAIYQDWDNITLNIDGRPLHITRNCSIVERNYQITVTPDYNNLLQTIEEYLDSEN